MSTEESTTDSSFDHVSNTDTVSRRELAVRLQLKEIEIVRLRRRLTWLEKQHDHDPRDDATALRSREDELLEELDIIAGRSDD